MVRNPGIVAAVAGRSSLVRRVVGVGIGSAGNPDRNPAVVVWGSLDQVQAIRTGLADTADIAGCIGCRGQTL